MQLPHSSLRRHSSGFTLIELLVVIAIIGILASIILASLSSARMKSRDARRIADIRQLQLALELYFDAQSPQSYPDALSALTAGCGGSGCIPSVPQDPLGTPYPYAVCAPATSYHLAAALEELTNPSLQSDADAPAGTCGGSDTIAGDAEKDTNQANDQCIPTASGGRYCYDVEP